MTREKTLISRIYKSIRTHPDKLNLPFESDCEFLKFENGILSLSTDSLNEEISLGIFKNPYSIGWYSALMSLSDIYAGGSKPLGLLLNLNLPHTYKEGDFQLLISGVEDCCKKHQTYILGGDTNFGNELIISTTAIGSPLYKNLLQRKNLSQGDILYATPGVGAGNLTAFLNLMDISGAAELELQLLPSINPHLARAIAKFANACIDTSDGLLHGIFDLAEQNENSGIQIDVEKIPMHPLVKEFSQRFNIPEVIFTGGEVGDYGLIFSIAEIQKETFENYCRENLLEVAKIGMVIAGDGVFFGSRKIDPFDEKLSILRQRPEAYLDYLKNKLC